MRTAKPNELTEHAVPVLAAQLSESELSRWIPVTFQDIDDPAAVAEPSKGALVKLEGGPYVVLFYGKESGQLVLRFPLSQNASADLRHFFREVPLPPSRIVWHRPDVELPPAPAPAVKSSSRPAKQIMRLREGGKFSFGSSVSKNARRPATSRGSKKR